MFRTVTFIWNVLLNTRVIYYCWWRWRRARVGHPSLSYEVDIVSRNHTNHGQSIIRCGINWCFGGGEGWPVFHRPLNAATEQQRPVESRSRRFEFVRILVYESGGVRFAQANQTVVVVVIIAFLSHFHWIQCMTTRFSSPHLEASGFLWFWFGITFCGKISISHVWKGTPPLMVRISQKPFRIQCQAFGSYTDR